MKDILENPKVESPKEPKKPTADFSENLKAAFTKTTSKKAASRETSKPKIEEVELVPGQVLPIQKAPHQRSKKALVRIDIDDVADDEEEQNASVDKSDAKIENEVEMKEDPKRSVEESLSESLAESKITSLPPKPKTSVQFVNAWKSLNKEFRTEYLSQLSAKDYPMIFKHSLEPKLFNEIVEVLASAGEDFEIASHLKGLASVPRISAIVMFMNPEELKVLTGVIEKLDHEDLKFVKKKLSL